MFGGNFIAPSPNTNTRSAKSVKGAQVLCGFHQPSVFKGISKQEDGACSSRRHSGIEKSRARSFCRSSRHVRRSLLVGSQMNQRLSFKPQMTGLSHFILCLGHVAWKGLSLMTAPMPTASVVRKFHTFDGVGHTVPLIVDLAHDHDAGHAVLQPCQHCFGV